MWHPRYLSLLSTVLAVSPLIGGQSWQHPSSRHENLLGDFFGASGNATYDYVIVGGGTAGLTLASRLAENRNITIAVIEAGNYFQLSNGNTSQVPQQDVLYDGQASSTQWSNPAADWGFLTTPQTSCNNKTLHYGRGKGLGGCSNENSMIYNRGSKGSYDQWAAITGDGIWTWDSLLPFFTRSIQYDGPGPLRASNASVPSPESYAISSKGRPLHLSLPNYALPIASWAQRAMQALGIEETQSLIGGNLIGAQYVPLTINPRRATRDSSQTSFLDSSMRQGHTNLKVYLNTVARKINFKTSSSSAPIATGVQASSNSRAPDFHLTARKEVIISAGAIQSPQLLMVSGIGPAETLKQYNISVVASLPAVGQNLWEHFLIVVSQPSTITGGYNQILNDPVFAAEARQEYYDSASGPLVNGNTDFLGWEKLPSKYRSRLDNATRSRLDAEFPADWPELEIEVTSADLTYSKSINGYATIIGSLIAPLSRGSVSINSTDTYDPPVIDLGLLSDPGDQQVAVQVFRRLREILQQDAMRPILTGDEVLPGLNVQSDQQILDYIKDNPAFNWHAACTCRMGAENDTVGSVLDSRARVHGVKNLRVVDASSFPTLPPGHPQANVYVLAERIAADILGA